MITHPRILCQHIIHEDGVHEFIFLQASWEAIDEWLAHIENFYRTIPPDQTIRMLVDTRQVETLPLKYAYDSARQLFARYPVRPGLRVAYVYNMSPLVALATALINMLRTSREVGGFFTPEKYDQAVEWLHADTLNL